MQRTNKIQQSIMEGKMKKLAKQIKPLNFTNKNVSYNNSKKNDHLFSDGSDETYTFNSRVNPSTQRDWPGKCSIIVPFAVN